jgi:hypothetical protein
MARVSITTAPLNRLVGKSYADLEGTLDMMARLLEEDAVDGFEFQCLAEWDAYGPPKDEYGPKEERLDLRYQVWKGCRKYTYDELAARLVESSLPVLSVHANRDVGICLCSSDEKTVIRGRALLEDTVRLAESVQASVAVFHLWDTYSTQFDPQFLVGVLVEAQESHPEVALSVENVPTHLPGHSPVDLCRLFSHITLDTRWAGMYDELHKFKGLLDSIVNVHLRGRLEGGRWVLDDAPFTFEEALSLVGDGWGYDGLFTLEPRGGVDTSSWSGIVEALRRLRL